METQTIIPTDEEQKVDKIPLFAGGIGDVFVQCCITDRYRLLSGPDCPKTVVNASRNEYAREIFQWHPNAHQFQVINAVQPPLSGGGWIKEDFYRNLGLSPASVYEGSRGQHVDWNVPFYPPQRDLQVLESLKGTRFGIFAPFSKDHKSIPEAFCEQLLPMLSAWLGGQSALYGFARGYQTINKRVQDLRPYAEKGWLVDLTAHDLTVPAAIELARHADFYVGANSCLALVTMSQGKPTVILEPVEHSNPNFWSRLFNLQECALIQKFDSLDAGAIMAFLGNRLHRGNCASAVTNEEPGAENIRQQFDAFPYPGRINSGRVSYRQLYFHSVQSASWRVWRKDIDQDSLTILDAGCGTGRTTLMLAKANPRARILGVDLSEKSIAMAREFARRQGLVNVEFECRSLATPDPEQRTFDYINADELLYLVPDLPATLATLSSMLKPAGILRGNFHCAYQRSDWLRLQKFFDYLGLMSGEASEAKINAAREVMAALNPGLPLATRLARAGRMRPQSIMSNLLLRGDKGFTFPQIFGLLSSVNLKLASMLDWPFWELQTLFNPHRQMDSSIVERLEEMSLEQSLEVMQLLGGQRRLLDFWAVRDASSLPGYPERLDSETCATHPVIPHPAIHGGSLILALEASFREHRCITLNQIWPVSSPQQIVLDPVAAFCVLKMVREPGTVSRFIDAFTEVTAQMHPDIRQARHFAAELLQSLENIGMVLIDRLQRTMPSGSIAVNKLKKA